MDLVYWVIAALFILMDAASSQDEDNIQAYTLTLSPVPWIGVLIFQQNENSPKAVTGVILIRVRIAIANARDMAKLNKFEWEKVKNKTTVMFLSKDNEEWFSGVENFVIHPEFNEETLTTIALLNLDYDGEKYKGDMLSWPKATSSVSYSDREIFAIGFTDRLKILEQIVYRMDYVNTSQCLGFYNHEELDSQWMRPVSYHCYKVRYSKDPCVFDPGLALVHHSEGIWTLLGMSSWGPGCALPARFLDFEYFVPWVVTKMPTRRLWKKFWESDVGPPVEDLDTWILSKINDTTMTLSRFGEKYITKTVRGQCHTPQTRDHLLIYRDRMNFTSIHSEMNTQGIYGVSLYDLRHNKTNYTCVVINAFTANGSNAKLWYTKSFEQGHAFETFSKVHPFGARLFPRRKKTPYIYHIQETWEKYTFEVLGTDVTHLMFRFEFRGKGYIEVNFFGNDTSIKRTTTYLPWVTHPYEDFSNVKRTRTTPKYRTRVHPYSQYDTTTTMSTTTPRVTFTTTTPKVTTTNWWNKWWRYEPFPDFRASEVQWWRG